MIKNYHSTLTPLYMDRDLNANFKHRRGLTFTYYIYYIMSSPWKKGEKEIYPLDKKLINEKLNLKT